MESFLSIFLIFAIISLTIFGWWYNSPKQKGKRGEMRIHDILMQLPDEYHVMDDVMLKTTNGTTQIDHIVVSKYGIFAIETKNYRGEIYGNDNSQEWKQIIITKVTYPKKPWKTYTYVTKNQFYNPVKQAVGHMYRIKDNLKEWPYLKVIPIVVFTGNADISKVSSQNHVIYDNSLLSTIQAYQTSYITDADVNDVVARLSSKNIRQIVDNKTHVHNVKEAKYKTNSIIASGICPQCGGTLVRRNGKYGSFYGCSNYPKCKFTTH